MPTKSNSQSKPKGKRKGPRKPASSKTKTKKRKSSRSDSKQAKAKANQQDPVVGAPSSTVAGLAQTLFAPVDISFLVFFRISFASIVLWKLSLYFLEGSIAPLYIDPVLHFTYHGFSWVRPWPGNGMYVHFGILWVVAFGVLVGFCYRICAVLLFLGLTYVFLLEKALYLNHDYLVCLFALLLIFLPANRQWSVDSLIRPSLKADMVSAWTLWLLRFQVGLPYFYGGLAKLNGDWLRGQPMQLWLSVSPWRVLLGPVAEEHWFALLFSWGGLIFDLVVVPFLLWKRTRTVAYSVAVVFHLMNAFMLNIGIFPWLMILATTVFFVPDWPKRLLDETKKPKKSASHPKRTPPVLSSFWQKTILASLAIYVGFHALIPFRHLLYPGNSLWTNEAHRFAWRMMLRTKVSVVQFLVLDEGSKVRPVDLKKYLTQRQFESLGRDPEMMREFAQYLRDEQRKQRRGSVKIRVIALSSLNGRKPQYLIDPRVDLGSQPRTFGPAQWIMPLKEPFRWETWNVPISEWPKHVTFP